MGCLDAKAISYESWKEYDLSGKIRGACCS